MLPDLIARGREPSVGITVHAATITLRVTAAGKNSEECYAAMEPTIATIRECLGALIFGEEDEDLEHAVVKLLESQDKSLATVEFGTRGLLAQWLSEATAGTDAFVVSQVFNNPPELTPADKRRAGVAADFDLTSQEYVQDLAVRFREKTGVDYCLAIGDFPEATAVGEPPVYHFGLASETSVVVLPSTLVSHPAIWRPRAAKQALNLLRLQLLKNDGTAIA
jgi:nicotinamide-nucleotide amidase